MFFIVKVGCGDDPAHLTMKNIVKAAVPLGCARWRGSFFIPSALPARKSPPARRKALAGCPFELGVRANVAEGGEGCGWKSDSVRI
ncbi:hypothetical protein [Paenibacillus eucommiae]|uniref:Uncharacterized protein n=1 Tax=Paenibacillus eucommiae TaxID=1355755 RepID=A0ABS4J2D2_9BACL|nr:hypothetical protein [Paenibacillus eucommiae]MBP1993978.1 hypothetical protein [Paenibacillus eucommiae]